MNRRVAVTGAAGQLGRAIQDLHWPGWDVVALNSENMNVREWPQVRDTITSIVPEVVIHAAAATNVDQCEREPDWAYDVNAVGTRNVARATASVNAELVYVSTNYVFDGSKDAPYHEFDVPGPISVYGASKLAGEVEARDATTRCYVIRTASVYARDGRNFVNTMRGLMERLDQVTVVDDQFSNPTYATDLAQAIAELLDGAPYGTYHVTNTGTASWHEWAMEVAMLTGATTAVVPIPASEYQREATPPANGAMTSLALAQLGISLPEWRDALRRCLAP